MTALRFSFPILIFLFCSCGNFEKPKEIAPKKKVVMPKQPKLVSKDGLTNATELIKSGNTPYTNLEGTRGDTLFVSSYKGRIVRTDTLHQDEIFLFDLKVEFMIDKIFIIPLAQNKWFISWQETDHEGVKSYSAVYKTGAEKPEWKLQFKLPNPGEPVMDGKNVYVTYLGVAGKLSLDEGKFLWKHDSLFNTAKEPFKKFQLPIVRDSIVVFVDYPIPGRRDKMDTLKVDPVTGKIIR